MKKIYFLLLLISSVIAIQAQTVCPASVTFRFCETTNGAYSLTIPDNLFPYEVNGFVFEDAGTHVFTLTNARGCDSLLTVTVTKKSAYSFTIASGTTIVFSKGNLQYCATEGDHACRRVDGTEETRDGKWRFALHQYDCLRGNEGNMHPGPAQTEWMDLFAYGTSGYNYQPYTSVRSETAFHRGNLYGGTNNVNANHDWGVYNAISNGGNEPGIWRMMTQAEWTYLLNTRTNANTKKGLAMVADVEGVILLPDSWVDPQPDGKTFVYGTASGWGTNTYSAEQWVLMELNGAVFLPHTGYRSLPSSGDPTHETTTTYYMASEIDSYNNSKNGVTITATAISTGSSMARNYNGKTVRLVK